MSSPTRVSVGTTSVVLVPLSVKKVLLTVSPTIVVVGYLLLTLVVLTIDVALRVSQD